MTQEEYEDRRNKISQLGLTVRASNVLFYQGTTTLEEVAAKGYRSFLRANHCGQATLAELKFRMDQAGITNDFRSDGRLGVMAQKAQGARTTKSETNDRSIALLREILDYLDRPDASVSNWYKILPEHVAKIRKLLAEQPPFDPTRVNPK